MLSYITNQAGLSGENVALSCGPPRTVVVAIPRIRHDLSSRRAGGSLTVTRKLLLAHASTKIADRIAARDRLREVDPDDERYSARRLARMIAENRTPPPGFVAAVVREHRAGGSTHARSPITRPGPPGRKTNDVARSREAASATTTSEWRDRGGHASDLDRIRQKGK